MSNKKDESFVDAILKQVPDATDRFYSMLKSIVASMGKYYPLSPDDIEDITHELYVRFVLEGKLSSYKGRAKLSTWLFIIVLRHTKHYLQSHNRVVSLPDPPDAQFNPVPAIENRILLDELMAVLNEKEKYVVKLSLMGYSPKEIAALMGVRVRRVYRIRERAIRKMREKIKKGKSSS